ncbi:MAG: zinc carboxypeptidase [Saprospiraceae bacterium]|nr:zinc carboxypeptidase [Saprospiraceae bacterium]
MRLHLYGLLTLFLCPFILVAQAPLQSPEAFLPSNYGKQFTPHYLKVDYFQYVAENSDRVQLLEYGKTNEDRPLILAFVSSPENLKNLELIRQANLARAGKMDGNPAAAGNIPIVWLSYGVHGNEAGASESSLDVLYKLADPNNAETTAWLESTLVIIDPCINPDGNSRYTSWYRSISGTTPDPDRFSREHQEPWPGGRVNHYYFDLNRDWAWATQMETRSRLQQYHNWMPHIHVDAHEQYPNDHYYFAPAAHPYHRAITAFQAEFQNMVGQNNAKSFDKQGWLYFTGEVFDLFYPSYGDTYPTFNGSIGMTYEQAGHGISGRAIKMENGDTLTIRDRIDHHSTATLTTVKTAFENREKLINAFAEYFIQARKASDSMYKSFVISGLNSPDKTHALLDLLDLHEIEYGRLEKGRAANGFDYALGADRAVQLRQNDIVIPVNQAQGKLVQVLFEPAPLLEDSLTYDITAWALPFAYGLKAYGLTQELPYADYSRPMPEPMPTVDPNAPHYAYLIRWESLSDARFLSGLLAADIKVRVAQAEVETEAGTFAPGTLVITRADNRKNPNWEKSLLKIAGAQAQEVFAVNTGFSINGPDFGSGAMKFLSAPRILLAWGDEFDPNAVGAAWHYFDQVLQYPTTIIADRRINASSLEDYDLLILTSGRLDFGESQWESLSNWIRGGGRVIAIGGALGNFRDREGYGLLAKPSPEEQNMEADPMSYGGRERAYISESVPGAIFKAKMDASHPISFGIGDSYYSLKVSGSAYSYLSRGSTVSYLDSDPISFGFAGWKARQRLDNSLVVGQYPIGRGSIIYLVDDPLFRGFWYQGLFLMSNAVFFTGS